MKHLQSADLLVYVVRRAGFTITTDGVQDTDKARLDKSARLSHRDGGRQYKTMFSLLHFISVCLSIFYAFLSPYISPLKSFNEDMIKTVFVLLAVGLAVLIHVQKVELVRHPVNLEGKRFLMCHPPPGHSKAILFIKKYIYAAPAQIQESDGGQHSSLHLGMPLLYVHAAHVKKWRLCVPLCQMLSFVSDLKSKTWTFRHLPRCASLHIVRPQYVWMA